MNKEGKPVWRIQVNREGKLNCTLWEEGKTHPYHNHLLQSLYLEVSEALILRILPMLV